MIGGLYIRCMDLLHGCKSLLPADNKSTLEVTDDWGNMYGIRNYTNLNNRQ
jgi:hypothetical protein